MSAAQEPTSMGNKNRPGRKVVKPPEAPLPQQALKTACYRVLADCRIGGSYRKKGSSFLHTRFEHCPAHLQEVGTTEDTEPTAANAQYVTADDIGHGTATKSADVTSMDMIKQ